MLDPEAMQRIQARIEVLEFREGWYPLVAKLDRDIAALVPDYICDCAKEKYGGLRYYIFLPEETASDVADQVNALIWEAEKESYHICERCGEPGRLRGEGRYWISTLCDSCDARS